MYDAIGGDDGAGYLLKSISGWEANGNGIDLYGFNVLPAGRITSDPAEGSVGEKGASAFIWTSSERSPFYAFDAEFTFSSTYGWHDMATQKIEYLSVRCVMDRAPADHN